MPIRAHWHVTRSWEDQDGLDVSPPLNRASSARLLWRLVQETGGEYPARRATKAHLNGRYVFFARWLYDGQACAPAWQTDSFASA